MKQFALYTITFLVLLSSCAEQGDLESRKKELAELKEQSKQLNARISELQEEIAAMDTTISSEDRNAVLVNLRDLHAEEFVSSIKLRGSVLSRTNVLLSAETPGRITSVKVQEGQQVSAGQVLVTLDNQILQNNIKELQTSLELAEAVYERQANLWEQKIGTEIQYLEAKNNVESLQSRLNTAYSQLAQSIVKAPFAGSIDDVPARIGEMAQPGMPLVRIVNKGSMYIEAAVSERFISSLEEGDEVTVKFPVMEKTLKSEITAISQVINEENRTFKIEVKLPKLDFTAKPNQVVMLDIVDYRNPSVIAVPTEVILSDAQGKYLFVASDSDGKLKAEKKYITAGRTQDGRTEIIDGIGDSSKLIVEGYRNVIDGTVLQPTKLTTETAKID